MKKKIILAGTILAAFLMLITPLISAINVHVTEHNAQEKILEIKKICPLDSTFFEKLLFLIWGVIYFLFMGAMIGLWIDMIRTSHIFND